MFISPDIIEQEMQKVLGDQVFGFTMGKLDALQQVKNVTAVVVRAYAPNSIPPQTGWIWVDTAGGKAYMSTATNAITDWSILGVLGGAIGDKQVAVGNTSGNLVSYSAFGYDTATGIHAFPIGDASTEYRVGHTKVVGAQGASVADASGGLTVDTEARTAINTLLARLRAHGIIAT